MLVPNTLRDNYVVAFFDVDGTLVERLVDSHVLDGKPSDAVCAAVRKFVEAGNVALLSTGRGPRAILSNLRELPFSGMVAMDGAYVEVGDEVTITNLWGTLTYKVTGIQIISPNDVNAILIRPGKDMITLLTCHPPNSGGKYRYLVFCERVKE